jgi:hypothetical protein
MTTGAAVSTPAALRASSRTVQAPFMFMISEADSDAIRTVLQQNGELSAAIELQRRFPGVVDNAKARECARIIASWGPVPPRPVAKLAATQTDGTTGAALPLTGKLKQPSSRGKAKAE